MAMFEKFLLALLAAALVAPSGCATIEKEKKVKALDNTLSIYREAMRWGYFDTVYSYQHPDKREQVPTYLQNVRVTGYDEIQEPVLTGELDAEQVVRIDYVLRDRQQLRTLSDHQKWNFDEESRKWWLTSGPPQF